ncbi:hypothetical protein PVAP13_6NG035400 [Panicum virgatum]|uniref:Uncharacterized protein n=1 Tax=Panicum virgatum TaxID=38727 RepID=A0A8T0QUN2_PANVG|nr:hypothetical protein PVAP13_6NG035400 [Panicum virgatum]
MTNHMHIHHHIEYPICHPPMLAIQAPTCKMLTMCRLKDMRHMVPMAHMGPMEPMAIAHINRMRLKNKLHVVCIV